MSTTRFFYENTVSAAGLTRYTDAAKRMVDNLVATVPGLYIGEVISDTTSQYTVAVYTPVSDKLRYYFTCSNSTYMYMYLQGYQDSNSNWTNINSDRLYVNYGSDYTSTVWTWGVGDWLVFWDMSSMGSYSYHSYGAYAYVTDASGATRVPLISGYTNSSGTGSPTLFWPNFYTYWANAGTYKNVGMYSDTSGNQVARYADIPFVLYPFCCHMTVGDLSGFLNIKWGGAYSLYLLYNTAVQNVVQQAPGSYANVNGTTVQSMGYVFLAV